MAENFERSVEWLLTDETGEEAQNDPSRAGNTYGLNATHLDSWGIGVDSLADVLTREFVETLYLDHIWTPCSCDALPSGLDYWLFDLGYRFNTVVAKRWLCTALKLNIDRFDIKLINSILEKRTPRDVIVEMDVLVRRRLKVQPDWDECKHWWTNRSNRARDRAIKLSREG